MYEQVHPSDLDLMTTADGEVSARRKLQVFGHLHSCRSCRERMCLMESTLAEFVAARNSELNRELVRPGLGRAGSQARLRSRLAEASRTEASPTKDTRNSYQEIWGLAPATGIFAGVLVVFVAIFFVAIFESMVNTERPKPQAAFTPGETRRISIAEVCRKPDADIIAWAPPETRRKVFSEYGIRANSSNFEVDYLITPHLGGADTIRNLWPQLHFAIWNAHVKDRLEERLHQLVCARILDLQTARHDIATDWIGAYKKYVGAKARR